MRLPGQADMTANISFGYEDDDFSVRLIANYRDIILEDVGACGEDAPGDECFDYMTFTKMT